MRFKNKKCYSCFGEPNTKDHIPPKMWFPSPFPANMITLPCCRNCQDRFREDEELTWAWLSGSFKKSPAGNVIETKVSLKHFKHRPKQKLFLQQFRRTILVNDAQSVGFLSLSGLPDIHVNNFFTRLAKGMLAKFFPEFNYSGCRFRVISVLRHEDPARLKYLEQFILDLKLNFNSLGEGVFKMWYRVTDPPESAVFVFQFYETEHFMVYIDNLAPSVPWTS